MFFLVAVTTLITFSVLFYEMRCYSFIIGNSKYNIQTTKMRLKSYITNLNSKYNVNSRLFSVSTKNFDVDRLVPIVEAPKLSNWKFKQVLLENGILVTLVHDGESEKSR